MKVNVLKCLFPLMLAMSCSETEMSSSTSALNGKSWDQVKSERQAQLEQYLKSQKTNYKYFTNTPIGYSGIPMLMWRLFPDIFPDIWQDYEKKIGLEPQEGELLPYGLGWGMGSTPVVNVPVLDNIRMQVVQLTCAGCHNGRVNTDGQEMNLIGAPTNRFDINRYRRMIIDTVNDPRYTLENFENALASKRVGWLYEKPQYLANETIDRALFKAKGSDIVEGIKANLLNKENKIIGYLGSHTYGGQEDMLMGGLRGQTEAFGVGAARLLPDDLALLPSEERQQHIEELLPATPGIIDMMSVWNQGTRTVAQWDGSIKNLFARNLGPALGFGRIGF